MKQINCTLIGENHKFYKHQSWREEVQELLLSSPIIPIFVEGIIHGQEKVFGTKNPEFFGLEDGAFKIFNALCFNFLYLKNGLDEEVTSTKNMYYGSLIQVYNLNEIEDYMRKLVYNPHDVAVTARAIETILPKFGTPTAVLSLLENPKNHEFQKRFLRELNRGTREDYWLENVIQSLPDRDFLIWMGAGHLNSFKRKIQNCDRLKHLTVHIVKLPYLVDDVSCPF
jgi:hypothetical protein